MFNAILISSMLAVIVGFFLLAAKMRVLTKGSASVGSVLRTAGLFSILVVIGLAAYPLAYPFSQEYLLWKGEKAAWNGEEIVFYAWAWFVILSIPAVIVTGGILLPRAIVKGLGASGFSAQSYKLTVVTVCGSMLIPCVLLAAENRLSSVPQEFRLLDASPKAWVLCASLAVGLFTTVIMCEKAMRRANPHSASKTRNFAVFGLLVSAELTVSALYNFILFIVGDYNECPCELEDYASICRSRLALSAAIFVLTLVFVWVCRSLRKRTNIAGGEK